ncbi:FxSxx-COOH system tetratricopeptide repeat protein [Actinocrispum sp. NPDC049592]|uniref:FxSxx-COOH system tetratricopeptide repeat protein n=1 Tax=Actinocrispum sp. NPDC049592 TaxID=3154835 RepID=UPI00343B4551
MIERLVAAIRAQDPEVTSTDIADVLWLAEFLPSTAADGADGEPDALPPLDDPARGGSPVAPPPDLPPVRPPADPRRQTGNASFRLPSDVNSRQGVPVGSPAIPAVPDKLKLGRSLRPLSRKFQSRRRTVPDEDRTAERIADTNLWIPSIRPELERWLDIALVVDSSASMVVWDQTVAEFREMLERAGMFRDVRLWFVDGDSEGDGHALLHSEMGLDRAGRDPAELVDPSGRRMILVVTDCVGRAWGNGTLAPVLARWGSSGPVAIVQLLPQRLWLDCVPEFLPVRMHNQNPGAPNARWLVRANAEADPFEPDLTSAGVPIPVVRLEPRWLGRWAALVAGATPGWVDATAIFTGMMSEVDMLPADPVAPLGAMDRVKRFRARSSPEAYKLAVYLSGAPLTLPVMRLVQQAMVPESKSSHLAEVFLSDLLHGLSSPSRTRRPHEDEIEYDFRPGVRAELLSQLSRSDALQVLSKVSTFVSQRLGSPNDFPALLTMENPPQPLGLSRPFARVAYDVLRSLGGRYADAARRLSQLSDGRMRREVTSRPSFGAHDFLDSPADENRFAAVRPFWPADDQRENESVVMETPIVRGAPPRNPHFTGRAEMLERLRQMLRESTERVALLPHTLQGLGGVGKTQLAVEYVYRYANDYELIYWISAENPDQVRTALARLGQIMRLPESAGIAQTIDFVLDALRVQKPFRKWLLVFDNADRPDALLPYLPVPTGHVLITSRNAAWTEVARIAEVPVLHREESIELLLRRAPRITREEADELAERLGDLPLALGQAAAWQAETGMPVREYLELFDDKLQLLTDNPPAGYPATLGATWQLSFDGLRAQSPDAVQLLEVCAFLGAEPIPVDLFWAGRHADLPDALAAIVRDNIRLRRALREISRYALAGMDPVADQFVVHRLVQAVLRANMTPETKETMWRAARRILAAANPSEPDNAANWAVHEQLSPHIVPAGVIDSRDEETRKVALDQVRYRFVRGDYEGSRDLGEVVVQVWQDTWGRDELWTLIARRHLANALRALGDSERAFELNEETLARMRETLGPDHEHTLAAADMFAADLRKRGLFRQALESDEDNYARHIRVFGENDKATVRVASNLAVNFRLLGYGQRAADLDRDSLRRFRDIFGDYHPRTLLSLSNNVRDMMKMGDYARALRMQEEVLPRHVEMLGPDHNDVLLAARNIVIGLRKTGQYARAEAAALDHLTRCRQRLGPNHEHTLAATTSYGNALRDNGNLTLARKTLTDAFERYGQTFGPSHPFTLACAANLAIVLRHIGEYRSALAMNQRTRPELIAVLGADHPIVLCCSINLASDLAMLHKHDQARAMSMDTLARSRMVRGDTAPYTLACAINAALDLQATGEAEAGRAAFEAALAELSRQLGESHPVVRKISEGARADCDYEVSPT